MRLAHAAVAVLVAATRVVAGDPGQTGRFPVGTTTLTLVDAARARTLVTEAWYPARTAARDAPPRGRFPLVIALHGNCGSRTNYEFLTTHLASRGFVVAAPDVPAFCLSQGSVDLVNAPLDVSYLRATLHDRHGPAAAVARGVRGRRTGVVGHSLGGWLAVRAATADANLLAVAALAAAAIASDATPLADARPPRAVIALGGTADTTAPLAIFTQPFFDAFAAAGGRPVYLVRITGGTHSGFTDTDSGLTPEALADQQGIVKHYVAAFLGRHLVGRRRDARWLRDADDGLVHVEALPR